MKKLIFTLAAGLSAYFMVAQNSPTSTTSGMQTPSNISNRFSTDYPNTNATWSMDGNNYRADYRDGNMGRSVTYDRNGNIISRGEQLGSGGYPTDINDYYTKNYPNERYEVWSSIDAAGNRTYYTDRNSERLMFDKNGHYKNRSKRTSQTGNGNRPNNK